MLTAKARYFPALWPLKIYLTVVETELSAYIRCWMLVIPTSMMAVGLESLRDRGILRNEEATYYRQ